MPDKIGSVINSDSGGKPAIDPDIIESRGNAGGNSDPEIITRYESPRTERFSSDGDAPGPRLTKSGKPDRRATRWQRGESTGTGTEKKSVHLNDAKLDLERVVSSIGVMLAGITHSLIPESASLDLKFDNEETKNISDAVREFSVQHGHSFDPKRVSEFNLAVVLGGVIGGRFVAVRNCIATKREAETPPERPAPININRPKTNGAPVGPLAPSQVFGDMSGTLTE